MVINVGKQLRAFRDVIAFAEGTDNKKQPTMDRGYDVIVGGTLLTDFSKHPRRLVKIPRYGVSSTAAGRYQMIWPTWNALAKRLGLTNFSPDSQDRACDELLRECGAKGPLLIGDFDEAIKQGSEQWASLPGSTAGQRLEKATTLRRIFVDRGGVIR